MPPVGIDVSSLELRLVARVEGKSHKPQNFGNTPQGYTAIIERLGRLKGPVRVCLEATGSYHFDLAVALSQAEGIEVMVINPKAARHFAEALMTRSKTDSVDAEMLACYSERMDFVPWQCPSRPVLNLRSYARRLAELTMQKTRARNQLHAMQATQYTPASILQDAQQAIAALEQRIAALKAQALAGIAQDSELARHFDLLLSVKGIGETSAVQILGELAALPAQMTDRQWVAHAGLDPRQFTSGTSVAKKPRLSKVGNAWLRRALYMPALVAAQREPNIRGYYLHLIEDNGLKKIQAVCAVMRKLLHAIHGMFASRSSFDGSRFYQGAMPVK